MKRIGGLAEELIANVHLNGIQFVKYCNFVSVVTL